MSDVAKSRRLLKVLIVAATLVVIGPVVVAVVARGAGPRGRDGRCAAALFGPAWQSLIY